MIWSKIFAALALVPCTLAKPISIQQRGENELITRSNLQRRTAGGGSYAVIGGDTGNTIAAVYSITFSTLSSANPNVNWNALQIGQALSMPSNRVPYSYTVASGDTQSSIAQKYDIYTDDLASANPSVNWSNLQIGTTLRVPGYGSYTTYTVTSGDYGDLIASAFSITFNSLSAANPSVNWNNLQIGQVLTVPAGTSSSTGTIPSSAVSPKSSTTIQSTTASFTTSKTTTPITTTTLVTTTKPSTTLSTTSSMVASTTKPTTASTTKSTTTSTTASTTASITKSTTASTTVSTTVSTAKSITSTASTIVSTLVSTTTKSSTSVASTTIYTTTPLSTTSITKSLTSSTTSSTTIPLNPPVPSTSTSSSTTPLNPPVSSKSTTSTTRLTTSSSSLLPSSATISSSLSSATSSKATSSSSLTSLTSSQLTSSTIKITTTTTTLPATTASTTSSVISSSITTTKASTVTTSTPFATISSSITTTKTTATTSNTGSSTSSKLATTTISSTTSVLATGEPSVSPTATVTGANYVTGGNNNDGVASRSDSYTFYQGNGSTAAGWPTKSQWISFSTMWNNFSPYLGQSCQSIYGVANNSPQENQYIYNAIQAVASKSGVDHRLILAAIIQESSGCVRVRTTVSPDGTVTNPGLMQDFNGSGSCNINGVIQNPCPASQIYQMVEDGTFGTSSDGGNTYVAGLVQDINASPGYSDAQVIYRATRIYNSGSIPANGDLGAPGATRCYASDMTNLLMGWVSAKKTCTLDG